MKTTPMGTLFLWELTAAYLGSGTTDEILPALFSLIRNFTCLTTSSWYIKMHPQIRAIWDTVHRGTFIHDDKSRFQFGGKSPREDPGESRAHHVYLEVEQKNKCKLSAIISSKSGNTTSVTHISSLPSRPTCDPVPSLPYWGCRTIQPWHYPTPRTLGYLWED